VASRARSSRRFALAAALTCSAAAALTVDVRHAPGAPVLARALADDDWYVEFEAVCSRTHDAMTMSSDELRALVSRCDQLKPRVAALDASRRKVFERRLQLCRDLYQFVLDTKEQK
jgi:hypothetical protein